jgi:hypothetical protein
MTLCRFVLWSEAWLDKMLGRKITPGLLKVLSDEPTMAMVGLLLAAQHAAKVEHVL